MDIYDFTIYMGIATYAMLFFTFLIGLRAIKFSFKVHKVFAIITFICASTHAGLFVYMNYFAG